MRYPTRTRGRIGTTMAQQGAAEVATLRKNPVDSFGFRIPTPPSSSSNGLNVPRENGGTDSCCFRSCCQAARIFSQNNGNFKGSGIPVKVMYYHNKSWVNFSDDVVKTLRTCFLDRKPVIQISIAGENYVFDLMRMLRTDCLTGHCRSISWIDENDKCFFPVRFYSDEEFTERVDESCGFVKNNNKSNCNPKIEIEVKIDRALSKRKLEEPEVNSTYKPVGLDAIKHQHLEKGGDFKCSNMKLLRETERTYTFVRDHFLNRMKVDDAIEITAIHQCTWESPLGKARLEVAQKQIEITKADRGTASTVYAWYGASSKLIESVVAYGFGSPSNVPVTDVHGIGIYLSPLELPHLSAKLADADDTGVKHLILCRVVLGNVEKVKAGSRQCFPSSNYFDTGSDDPKNPKWYVIWSTNANMHILPEFVLSFRLKGNMQVQPVAVASHKYSLQKLFSKLERCLPPAKFQEMLKSYGEYKCGMIARATFLSQIRMIAGNEVLRSAIYEMSDSG